jgi:hypothetical protein
MSYRNRVKSFTVTTVLISLAATLPVLADVIVLQSGNEIKGELLSVDSKVVKLKNERGKVVINRERVVKIIFGETEKQEKVVVKEKQPESQQKPKKVKPPIKKEISEKPATAKQEKDEKTKLSLRPKVVLESDKKIQQEDKQTTPVAQKAPETEKKAPLVEKNEKPAKQEMAKVQLESQKNEKFAEKVSESQPAEKIKIKLAKTLPTLEFVTYITGSKTGNTYFGIYSNPLDKGHLTLYLPEQTSKTITYTLHAQKNGNIPPLYTGSSVIFVDKTGAILAKTNPVVVENDNFIEWFSNLEDIAGITGKKEITVNVPSETYLVKIIGYRPGSKNNLVGYVSDIKINGQPIQK